MTTAEAIKTLKPPITVEQWAELEGPPHYELVNGELREKPDVAIWHEFLLARLWGLLRNYIVEHKLGELLNSKGRIKIDRYHGREPDFLFVPKDAYPLVGKNLFKGVPPLVIEILSPNNEEVDREDKRAEYARLGIGEYWIVDFPNRAIEVYQLDATASKPQYRLAEKATGPLFRPTFFPGLELPLAEIWPTEFENRSDD